MKIIKRNGSEVDFDLNKIVVAVTKANAACEKQELTASQIQEIAEYVEFKTVKANRALSVEEIQDIVEDQIMAQGAFEVARRYVRYRYTRSLIRKANTTDNQILSSLSATTRRSSRKTPTRTPPLTACSGTIWPARCLRTSPSAFCCPRILWRPTRRALFTSMTATTLPSICTTATW